MSNRIHRSQEEWQSIIELEKKSGLIITEFCLQHELNYKYHSKRRNELYSSDNSNSKVKKFIKLEAPNKSNETYFELQYIESTLQISSEIEPNWVAQFMNELS